MLNDFFYTLFPEAKDVDVSNAQKLVNDYYSRKYKEISVSVVDGILEIDFVFKYKKHDDKELQKAMTYCDNRNYKKAVPLLKTFLDKYPFSSDALRALGQIESDLGNQDAAIELLQESLRWNPKNVYALLMLGNIYAKYKNDIAIGMKYYEWALEINPNDYIVITNIGGILLQSGNVKRARELFRKSLEINNRHPNTHFNLGLALMKDNDFFGAFESTVKAIKFTKTGDKLYKYCTEQLFEIFEKISKSDVGKTIVQHYKIKLENLSERSIVINNDDSIATPAKIEFAEIYGRNEHVVKFRKGSPALHHLMMHEMVHLEFVLKARKLGKNKLFISSDDNYSKFIYDLKDDIDRLKRQGVADDSIDKYIKSIFSGINNQIYSTPVDMLIESYLYNEFPELRPYQFYSLYNLNLEGIKAVTGKDILKTAPQSVMFVSRVFNLLNAYLLRDFFGIDLVNEFKPSSSVVKTADNFFEQFKMYQKTFDPGDEYELIMHWAKALHFEKYFELVDENEFRNSKRNESRSAVKNQSKDTIDDRVQEEKNELFREFHNKTGLNMSVAMFMVEALDFFDEMSIDDVKVVAFEIALKGAKGYNLEKNDYEIVSMPGKIFTGYEILAYYYVSCLISMPEILFKLQLPFDDEYSYAQSVFSEKKSTK